MSATTSEQLELGVTLRAGIANCRRKQWHAGLHYLLPLVKNPPAGVELPGLAYSCAGLALARAERRHRDALLLCRLAVEREFYEPENWLNLAWVHLLAHDRRRAQEALQRGLEISPQHAGLRALGRRLGLRRAPVLPLLSRRNPLNVWLGKVRHQRESAAARH